MNWTIETSNAMVNIYTNALNEPISEETREVLLLEKRKWETRRDVKIHHYKNFCKQLPEKQACK